jgi:hypothetical protein
MISPSWPSVAPSCRRWSGRRKKADSAVKNRKFPRAASRNAGLRIRPVVAIYSARLPGAPRP